MKIDNQIIVIIDPQYDFINPQGFYAKKHSGIDQILRAREKINALLKVLPKEKTIIVFSNYRQEQFQRGLSICIPGTLGHKIDLDYDGAVPAISKEYHSCFSSDDFRSYLESNNIKSILLCGFLAEYCVKQTAIDGIKSGYQISILKDLVGTGDDVQHKKEQMLIELAEKGVEIISDNFN